MAENELYSAYHWAQKARKFAEISAENASGSLSATEENKGLVFLATSEDAQTGFDDSKAMTPLKTAQVVYDNVGRGIQLGFLGTLENDVLTFETTDEEPYVFKHNYDYEIDLLFEGSGAIDESTPIYIKNGDEVFNILSVHNTNQEKTITFGQLKQACHYNAAIGWRWIFNARYTVTSANNKVFVIPASISDCTPILSERLQAEILENPEYIRYTMEAGTLRLLKGSEISFPDGTRRKLTETLVHTVSETEKQVVFTDGTFVYHIPEGQCFAGETEPDSYEMMLWFDTANNVIKYSGDFGMSWDGNYAFPVAIGSATGIDVCHCHGIGWFANCIWVDEGVKVLMPNGITQAGLFNNISYKTPSEIDKVFDNTITGFVILKNNNTLDIVTSYTLKEEDNILRDVDDSQIIGCPLGKIVIEAGRITSFEVAHAFTFVKKDLSNVSANIDYVVETYTDSNGNGYRIYKSGWIEQFGFYNGGTGFGSFTVNLLKEMANTTYFSVIQSNGGNHDYGNQIDNRTTTTFSGNNRQVLNFFWYVCGQVKTED